MVDFCWGFCHGGLLVHPLPAWQELRQLVFFECHCLDKICVLPTPLPPEGPTSALMEQNALVVNFLVHH